MFPKIPVPTSHEEMHTTCPAEALPQGAPGLGSCLRWGSGTCRLVCVCVYTYIYILIYLLVYIQT